MYGKEAEAVNQEELQLYDNINIICRYGRGNDFFNRFDISAKYPLYSLSASLAAFHFLIMLPDRYSSEVSQPL